MPTTFLTCVVAQCCQYSKLYTTEWKPHSGALESPNFASWSHRGQFKTVTANIDITREKGAPTIASGGYYSKIITDALECSRLYLWAGYTLLAKLGGNVHTVNQPRQWGFSIATAPRLCAVHTTIALWPSGCRHHTLVWQRLRTMYRVSLGR